MAKKETLDYLPENEQVYMCLSEGDDPLCGWWERMFNWYKEEIPTKCEDCGGAIKEGYEDYDI